MREKFFLDPANPRYRVWSVGREEKSYFSEWLPSFFERTLVFRRKPEGGTFSWIFTGPRGRFVVTLTEGVLTAEQYYTDSFALYGTPPEEDTEEVHRHPETCFRRSAVSVVCPERLTVRYNSHLQIEILTDGRPILVQKCTLELTRHQLSLASDTGLVEEGWLEIPEPISVKPLLRIDKQHQEIMGFGGIASVPSYAMLSKTGKERWFSYLKEYNLLIQREYPSSVARTDEHGKGIWDDQNLAVPHYYGNNVPVGEISDFSYNQRVQEIGGIVWFEFWHYPEEDYENGVLVSERVIRRIVDYCRQAKEKTGKAPAVVGIQNERCEPEETLSVLVPGLRRALDENGFGTTRLATCNASFLYEGKEYMRRFRKAENVWDQIDFSASNMYDYQEYIDDPDGFCTTMKAFLEETDGKPFLSTEISRNRIPYQEDSYLLAFQMGRLYHNNLTVMDACAICYCWTLMDVTEPSYGFTRTLFTVDASHGFVPVPSGYILRTFGAFSRHVQAGMKRVEMEGLSDYVSGSAYVDEKRKTCIFLNYGILPAELDLSEILNGNSLNWQAELCDMYHENEPVELKQKMRVESGSILTIYSK